MSSSRGDLPRLQEGSSPQRLLATLLGEYFLPDVRLTSAAVVAMLAEFQITEASARTALSRVIRRGLVTATRRGRETTYSLSPEARATSNARRAELLNFGAVEPEWNGDWTVIAFSLPEGRQAARHRLRRALGQWGFVRLMDSLWIRPGRTSVAVTESIRETLSESDDATLAVMDARFPDEQGPTGPRRALDFSGLRQRYEDFIHCYAPVEARIADGRIGEAEALDIRTRLMDAWRQFPDADPGLPADLLPPDWPRARARHTFVRIHRALGPLAEARLRSIVMPQWPEVAAAVTHFVSATHDAGDPAVTGVHAPHE